MGFSKWWKEWQKAEDPALQECLHRARQDVLAMIEGQPPQEGEDYGPWKPQMGDLRYTFEQSGALIVQEYLAKMLDEGEVWPSILLDKAVAPDGRPWVEVMREKWEEEWRAEWEAWEDKVEAELKEEKEAERRAAAEQRMRERLARTTGDDMADEILALLREQDLSRTDIYRHFSRNVTAASINDALFVLGRLGWARWKTVSTGGRGREVWYLPPDEE